MVPKKNDIEFQIEMLKIQLDMDHWMGWFFAIFAILITLYISPDIRIPRDLRLAVGPFLIGSSLLFVSLQSSWKEKKLSELRKKYLR